MEVESFEENSPKNVIPSLLILQLARLSWSVGPILPSSYLLPYSIAVCIFPFFPFLFVVRLVNMKFVLINLIQRF